MIVQAGGPGFFEVLTGHFANGAPIENFDAATQLFLSVRDNIERIINTRQNSLAHLPDYGLDDLSLIFRQAPQSARLLQRSIEHTLLKYEPRLRSIELKANDPEPGMLLSFTMTCHLHEAGLVRFGTHFVPDGQAQITLIHAEQDSCQ